MAKVDTARFAMVQRPDVPRSAFDIRYNHKTTLGAKFLYPIYVDEVLPGDSLRLRMNALARLATPIVPIMDDLYLETFFFFVPNRLVWSNWERFMGEKASITDTTQFLMPQVTVTDAWTSGRPEDYFGLQPPAAGQTYGVSALPWRAYNLIWNDWFRDEDLQNPLTVTLGDGPDTMTDYDLKPRGKRHDYFTSARPWPAKPQAQANMSAAQNLGVFTPGNTMNPVGLYGQAGAPVSGLGWLEAGAPTLVAGGPMRDSGLRTWTPDAVMQTSTAIRIAGTATGSAWPDVRVLVNDMRTAVQVQHLIERNARGGTRYAELVRAHFGVLSPDARLQRPEYLGGGRTIIGINPVAQTSETTAGGVLGELAAIGTGVARHGFSASFTEHGWILGLANIRGELTYQRGVNRMWFRRTVYDHYFPSLAHLGEQAVMSKEVWTDGTSDDDLVFGYQERWSEYKYKPSMTTGFMNSNNVGTPLDIWHLGQKFGPGRPVLNAAFVEDGTPLSRVLQVSAFLNQQVLLDASFDLRWVRPMPMFSLPGVGGRL